MGWIQFIVVLLLWKYHRIFAGDLNTNRFPDGFLFGVATASYQIEGAWNESDKSEDIWSHLTHNYPELVRDRSNGDVACDAYHHTDDDVALLKDLGVDFYRFSISWTRLLPSSFDNRISRDGLAYYNNLIDALVAANITPMISIYHWDLPNLLQSLGGWTNPKLVEYFTDYARIVFENFGDRVKYWMTFNEPFTFCTAYGSSASAPAMFNDDGISNYLCARTILLSHASTYRLYNETFKPTQNGKCGIALNSDWYEANSTSEEDEAAADRRRQFMVVPWGFTKLLVWIKEQYNNPEIIITENGYGDYEGLEDDGRVNYYKEYLSALLDAISQEVNVVGYTAWSFMDNFEWLDGYVVRFGIYHVNMSDPQRPRTPKSSGIYYKQVITNRALQPPSDNNNNSGVVKSCSIISIAIVILVIFFLI